LEKESIFTEMESKCSDIDSKNGLLNRIVDDAENICSVPIA
jgi:hypothetical protein